MTSLAARLYAALAAQPEVEPGNLALSPHSVAVALTLAAYGARGRTRAEIEAVVGGAGRPVEAGEGVELSSANRLFGQQGLGWAEDLESMLSAVDYADEPAARAAINGWTAQETHDLIREIVPEGVLDADTLLVLVNALYLKAAWDTPFPASSTTDADFHLVDGSVVRVPTMVGHVVARVGAGDGWRSAGLPYVGGRLAMTVVLPDPGRVAEVEASWDSLLEVSDHARLELHLPRFTVRGSSRMGEVLTALGMPTAFTDDADFSGFTQDAPLKISAVLHEAFVAVGEEGTEAGAATAVVMVRAGGLPAPPVPFVVDRPFLFVVHEVETGTPLFIGRVVDPRQ